ncbi:Protein of unknown function [Pyronema omphalodes CBS 100304]|uniref:Uncharacterized protein n=1 Tax=Pyronema omphalodes (strain CBS 100304) TaxID=1076935 RepID=U4LE84_PYROM|nr:Protein of unknown function [Pyronema omphalodes CBS 100304]
MSKRQSSVQVLVKSSAFESMLDYIGGRIHSVKEVAANEVTERFHCLETPGERLVTSIRVVQIRALLNAETRVHECLQATRARSAKPHGQFLKQSIVGKTPHRRTSGRLPFKM